jgi:hypothetical protein
LQKSEETIKQPVLTDLTLFYKKLLPMSPNMCYLSLLEISFAKEKGEYGRLRNGMLDFPTTSGEIFT